MGNLTRYGIAYNLPSSPYRYTWLDKTFHFSSAGHMERFKRFVNERREWMNDSLSRRFKVTVHADELAVIQLYMQTETRGFYVVMDDMDEDSREVFDNPEQLTATIEVW